jgi:mortality factor 4-like protein 1
MDSDSDQATQQTGSSKKQSKKMAGEKEFKGSPFSYGEKVYCDLGDIVYEGKVERRRAHDSSYLVHYLGWNKTWDEWLPEDKLFKMEDVDILKQVRDTLVKPCAFSPENKVRVTAAAFFRLKVAEGKKTIQQPGKSAKVKSSKNLKIK